MSSSGPSLYHLFLLDCLGIYSKDDLWMPPQGRVLGMSTWVGGDIRKDDLSWPWNDEEQVSLSVEDVWTSLICCLCDLTPEQDEGWMEGRDKNRRMKSSF